MAGFHGCLKTSNDPVIDKSLSESSGSVEVLDTSDEGKKSRFKAFKDFFGKKKKREPVDVYRGRSLKSSFSGFHFNNSSLNLAQEGQQSKSRVKGNMEAKSLSHESTFMLDPETEIPASKTCPSQELQRGRSLEIPPMRPHKTSIRPPVTGSETISKDFEKVSVDAQPPKTPRKALSQKIMSLKSSFEPSSGPIHSQSLTTFAVPTSSGNTQLPIGFSTPATPQDCLDSSASEHKMALSPQKQKKKNPQVTVKPKQEELSLPLVAEEKSKTKPKATHEEKPKKDSAGPLTQEQSSNTEISKTTDQATKTDATGSQGDLAYGRQSGKKGSSASGKSESRPRGRSITKSSRRLDLGNRDGSPSADKAARESHFQQLPLEKQVTGQPIALATQAEATTPQELLSDENYMERRKAGLYYETRKVSVPHPIPKRRKAYKISGSSECHEDGASGTKSEARASLLSVVESPSTSQEDVMFSVAGEAQVCMSPSHIQAEEEAASSFDSQSAEFKMESAQDISNICKKKSPGNVLQAFPVSMLGMASALPERGISVERLPPRSLSQSMGKPEAEEVASGGDSTSEVESGSEQQLAPGCFLQPSGDPEDDEEGFAESSSFVGKLSSSHEHLAPSHATWALGEPEDKVSTESKRYFEKYSTAKDWSSSEEDLPPRHPSWSLGKPEGEEISSNADSTSEVESGSEQQLAPGCFLHSSGEPEDEKLFSDLESASQKGSGSKQQLAPNYAFQSSGEPEDDEEGFVESSSFVGKLSSSHEQLVPSRASQALEEPKDEVSTQSNRYLAKYDTAKGWSSSEKDQPPRHPSLASEKPKDQKEVFSVSKNTAEEWGLSVEQAPPRRLPEPFMRPFVQQQLSKGSTNTSSEWVPMPSRHIYQPWLKPKPKQQASASPESTALEWAIAMEPLPPRVSSRRQLRRKVEQPVSSGPEIATIEGITSMELPPPGTHSQPLVKPISEQEISAGPESTVVEGTISMEPLPPKLLAHHLMSPEVEQNVFLGSEGAEKVVSVEPSFSECCPQCLTDPEAQHIVSENTTGNEGMFVELLPPKCPPQPLVRLSLQPENITCDSGSASKEWGSPMEVMPPRHTFYPYVKTSFEQPSAGPKSTAVEWGIPVEPLLPGMPSQPLMRPVTQQKVFERPLSASAQWSGLVEPIRSTNTLHLWVSPKFEQQAHTGPESTVAESSTLTEPLQPRLPSEAPRKPVSTGPESIASERGTSTELPPPRQWSIVRHKVQKMSPRFEKAAAERVISGRAQPPKYPIHFLNFEAREVSLDLQNAAVEGGMSKKSLLSRCPSQSFVKYMAQHIFSESPDKEQQVYVDPLASNQPSKSLPGPKVEYQVFSGCESADIEGGISPKLLPTKCPLQSLERPENPQEVFSYSESAPVKWSCPQEQWPPRYLSQTYVKFEHKQEVSSVSQTSLEEWACSEEQKPSRCTFQAEGEAEFQPQILSTGSVSVPIECSSAGHHLPPRQPFQAFAGPEYQQRVYSSSMSVAAKATIFESNPSSCSQPTGPASPNKTGKHSQGSEDLIKNIPTSATKPVKFTVTPVWPTSISGDSYPKEEVPESSDPNDGCSSLSTSEADVENLFGVRLRRIPSSQKYKSKEQEHFTKLPSPALGPVSTSVGRESEIRSASKVLLHTEENLTAVSDFAEKQQSKPKSDSMPKKQPAYKIPEKADQQSDYATSEPVWITMAKQKQRKFQTEITMEELKANNRAGQETETKGAGCVHQTQPREIFTSNVDTQENIEQMTLPKSTDPGFENQKICQVPAMRKETRHSSAHPAMFQEPAEPIWFSMAKKKAKAWSYITEIMHDPVIDKSLSESSGSVEVLDTSDEGKKSRFKAFKDFFGKKKKREPVDVYRGRSLKSSFSGFHFNNSSLNLAQEGQQSKSRVKGNMEAKSLSHESTFMLDPETEIPASKTCPSQELQRGRSLEIPPMRPHKTSIRPPVTGSETISKDFEKVSVDAQPPKTPRKALSQKIMSLKSSFEPSSGPIHSQSLTTFAVPTSSGNTQLPIGFSTPATPQDCLDSSASEHKMALSPQKQKKKNPQVTVKPKQEELSLPLVAEEKSKTKPKATHEEKPKKDSAGPLTQEQSSNTEISKTTDQATKTDATGSQGDLAYGRQSGKKGSSASGKSESRPRGRSITKSSRRLDLGNRDGSPSADKAARESHFQQLPLEKQVTGQSIALATQAEATTPQELLSDENYMERRKAGLYYETRKVSVPHPIPKRRKAYKISGSSECHEDGASGTKSEARASLLSVVESPSTSQEDVMFSVAGEAQVCMSPSHIQAEEEAASSFDSQSAEFKMESAQDISNICKKKSPGNVLQAFPVSMLGMASALPERGISVERLPPRSLSRSMGKPEAEEVASGGDSTSEVESGSEQQLAPGCFLHSSGEPEDEKLFSDLESASQKGSGSKQQLAPNYAFQSSGEPEDDEEGFVESSSFVGKLSSSHEQLVPSRASQALEEPKDEVSTQSNRYLAKYDTAKGWSSSEKDQPPRHPSLASEKPKDQKEVFSVSKNTAEEWGLSVEQAPPRRLPEPFMRPFVQQQLSKGSTNTSSEWVPMPSRHIYQPWLKPKPKQQASASPESTALEWAIAMEPLPPRVSSRRQLRRKVEQPVSSGPEIATIEGITSMELPPPGTHSQPLVKPISEQEISAGPESTVVEGTISMEPLPPKLLAHHLMSPEVEQNVFLGSEGAEKVVSVEPSFSECCPQCLTDPEAQHIVSENTTGNEGMFVELLPPKCPPQPLVRLSLQPENITCDSGSASKEWGSPMEVMPPRHTFYPYVKTSFEQPSAGPKSTAVEWGIPVEPLLPGMPSQPLMRPVTQQKVFERPLSASAQWSGLVEPIRSTNTLHLWVSPKFEQQAHTGPESTVAESSTLTEPLQPRLPSEAPRKPVSTGPESIASERGTSTELPPPRQWSIVRHKVQKMSPRFEKAAAERVISGRAQPPKYPIHFLNFEAREVSLDLQNAAVEGGMSKKSLLSRCPSQSFVKYMAQHIFSESPDKEQQVYVDPLASNQPSKSLPGPKVEYQVFSGCESADIEGGISPKLLPTKCPLQSLERPENPQEVFSYSESAPVKWSCPQEQWPPRYLSQTYVKFEHKQEVSSVSQTSLEEWACSEEQKPSRCTFQAEGEAEFQPQILSTGSVSVPIECSSAGHHLPPRQPFQAFAGPEYQQRVYSSSMSVAAKATIFESNPSSCSQPTGPASPNKTGKHSQGSEDLIKNIPTSATKPVKFTVTPVWPTSISGDSYPKEEVPESSDPNDGCSSLSTSEADVENLFGVRLRRIPSSQKYKSKEQEHFTKLPSPALGPVSTSVGRESEIRSASKVLLHTEENLTAVSDFAEKQQSKPKSDSMPKKQPAYKIPEKADQRSDYATSEPVWITMAKQKQRKFQTEITMEELKANNRAGQETETKGAGCVHQTQPREIFTSNVDTQENIEQMTLPKSTDPGFENQKICQVPAMRKETRHSSAHPAMFQEPAEPIWFSMAKKKAKAWSYITEIMHDPVIDKSLSESSGSVEVLDTSDEGKKSRFKAFKDFFGKKKKREPVDVYRGRSLKSSFSGFHFNNSSLNLAQEGQQSKSRVKGNMEAKSLSHESTFMLDPETEIPASKTCPSQELQRGRSLEIPPMRPHKTSIRPPVTGSETISKDFEKVSVDAQPPKTPRKALSQKIMSLKSSFEPSSGPIHSQSLTTFAVPTSSGNTQLPIGFSTPATPQDCLDSSASEHKMALSPQKQKKKNPQVTVKPKQEELSLPLVAEEKSKTKPKATHEEKPKKDSAGPLTQEQSSNTEISKTTDQATKTDATGSQGDLAYGRQSGKKGSSASGKSESRPRGRSITKSSRRLDLGNRDGSPSADKAARESHFQQLPLEKQVTGQPIALATQAEATTPQELLSDENYMERRKAGLYYETRKVSVPHPIPKRRKAYKISGSSKCHEDGASGTKSEARASLLSVVESPSTSQEDVMFSVAGEAQVCMSPSHIQAEEEAASSFDSQSAEFKMESAQDISNICKKKSPGNVLQAFPVSMLGMASALPERGISVERLPPRSLSRSMGKPEAEEVASGGDSTSEVESGSEQQLAPGCFLHSSGEPEDEKLFSDLESASQKGSGSKQQLAPNYAFQSSGEPEDDEEGFVESSSFVGKLSSSHEQLVPSRASQALEEPKDEVSTQSNRYLAKYDTAKGWSSSEKDQPPRHPSLASEKPKDQKEVFSVSKNTAEEWGLSVEQAPPRRLPEPFMRPFVQQQLSKGSTNTSSEWVPMPSRHIYQPWLKPKPKQQASASPESTALEWAIAMEPLPPRVSSRRQLRRKVEQPVSSGPEIATIEGITSMELPPPGTHSQPLVKPISEQEISAGPESTVVEGTISMEPLPPKLLAHHLMSPEVEQNVFLGSEGAEKVVSVEPSFSECCPQCLTDPEAQHIVSENTTGNEGMFVELLPPKCPPQPLVRLSLQPENITCDSGSASKEWGSPMEVMPPRHTFYPYVKTSFEQPSAGPKSTAVEWGIPVEPLLPGMPSQPLMRPVTQQKVFERPLSASAQWSGLVEPIRSTNTLHLWVSPKFEQQAHTGPESTVAESSTLTEPLQPRLPSEAPRKPVSTGPESIASERGTSTELPPPRQWSIVRHKVQKMSPRFEKAAAERVISGRAQPPKYPIHFLNFEAREVSLDLQNAAVEGGMSKKSLLSRCPSQSFVKYMAQHIFSESPDKEQQVYVDPLASNQPSKSLPGPKVEYQVFSGCESADIEGGISPKLLPTKCPLQSLERPENPQEVFSYSESAPVKWSCPQEQWPPRYLSQTYVKFEHKQEVSSVSQTSLEEWACSEEQKPSRCTFQAEGEAEFQPQILSTGSVSVPIECSSAGHHLPPRQPFQAFAGPEYQQRVYSSSMSVAAKATIFESNPSSCSQPTGPASPNKTGKHSQGSEDLIKNIPTSATKPVKFTVTPVWPTSISGDSYPKEEVPESSDPNDGCSSLSTSEADVENLFGVRLRRIPSSQKYKSKEQEHFTKLPSPALGPVSTSVGRESEIRSASKVLLHTEENLTAVSDFAEKQQSKPKSDSMPKKQPAYKIPEKADQRSDYATSEPVWITMAKQKQRKFQTEITMEELKANNRAGQETETKGAGCVHQTQPREIFTSNVDTQENIEQMTLPKSTDPGFENQKICQVPAMRKETRHSSAHPAMFQEPAEPIWFSMAKKKAKAWSYITEIMQ